MDEAKAANCAGMLIASKFANTILSIVNSIILQDVSLRLSEFHFESSGKLVPYADAEKDVSTNPGTLRLIKSLITAKSKADVNRALATDFTAVAADLPYGDRGGGCGGGFQVYIRGKMVLTAGGGGGGGYSSDHERILERGGGGGAFLFLPDGVSVSIGGGHGLIDPKTGTVNTKNDEDHNPKLFVKKLQALRELLSGSKPNDIAVLGGGGGGGGETEILRLRSQGEKTVRGGYGFGFEIGSTEAIKLAKLGSGRAKRTIKAPDSLTITSFSSGPSYVTPTQKGKRSSNDLNLPGHLLKEEWAIKMAEYKGKFAKS